MPCLIPVRTTNRHPGEHTVYVSACTHDSTTSDPTQQTEGGEKLCQEQKDDDEECSGHSDDVVAEGGADVEPWALGADQEEEVERHEVWHGQEHIEEGSCWHLWGEESTV